MRKPIANAYSMSALMEPSGPPQRADQDFSSQDTTITLHKRPTIESQICVDAATDHKHVDGLDMSTSLTYSSPHQPSQLLVDVHTGERSLQPAIASIVLRKSSAVECIHGYPVDVSERSLEMPAGNSMDCRRYVASAYADHAMSLTGYNRISISLHGRLDYPAVPCGPIQKTPCLVSQQFRRSSFDYAGLLPLPSSQ